MNGLSSSPREDEKEEGSSGLSDEKKIEGKTSSRNSGFMGEDFPLEEANLKLQVEWIQKSKQTILFKFQPHKYKKKKGTPLSFSCSLSISENSTNLQVIQSVTENEQARTVLGASARVRFIDVGAPKRHLLSFTLIDFPLILFFQSYHG